MLSPGVPTSVADAIARDTDPHAMGRDVVNDTMRSQNAAAFDVLDLAPAKVAAMRDAVKGFNDAAAAASKADPDTRAALRDDVRSVEGMARFPSGKALPWRADRPAIAAYDAVASDGRLSDDLRAKAAGAERAVNGLVLAHRESRGYDAFEGADYRDAAGPTVHLPVTRRQIDPWAPQMRETNNAFYKAVDGDKLTGALV